ncbi:MAG: Flp family type IVb pilin [Candidatus Sericytochromatia bacterium]
MKDLLVSLLRDEEGQGMVEYGIIIALISVVAIVAIKSIGGKTQKAFEDVDKNLVIKK